MGLTPCLGQVTSVPVDFLMFDHSYNLYSGYSETESVGVEGSNWVLEMHLKSLGSSKAWMSDIHKAAQESVWTQEHRYGGFAPIRSPTDHDPWTSAVQGLSKEEPVCHAQWFVDGASYYAALVDMIRLAKRCVARHECARGGPRRR